MDVQCVGHYPGIVLLVTIQNMYCIYMYLFVHA